MKEQIIQLPDNFEVKEIKDGKIILVEKKKLTYENILIELKPIIHVTSLSTGVDLYATSNKMFRKIEAINKLTIVAKYLNGDWQPDWNSQCEKKCYIYIGEKQIRITYTCSTQSSDIYFKTEKLAEQAIEILGEETIRLALCTDY